MSIELQFGNRRIRLEQAPSYDTVCSRGRGGSKYDLRYGWRPRPRGLHYIRRGEWRIGYTGHWWCLRCWLREQGDEMLRLLLFEALTPEQLRAIGVEVEEVDEEPRVPRIGDRIRILSDRADGATVHRGDLGTLTAVRVRDDRRISVSARMDDGQEWAFRQESFEVVGR